MMKIFSLLVPVSENNSKREKKLRKKKAARQKKLKSSRQFAEIMLIGLIRLFSILVSLSLIFCILASTEV